MIIVHFTLKLFHHVEISCCTMEVARRTTSRWHSQRSCGSMKKEASSVVTSVEWSVREWARRVWPYRAKVPATNCLKFSNPTMAIEALSLLRKPRRVGLIVEWLGGVQRTEDVAEGCHPTARCSTLESPGCNAGAGSIGGGRQHLAFGWAWLPSDALPWLCLRGSV
jgi:hypothetical protein